MKRSCFLILLSFCAVPSFGQEIPPEPFLPCFPGAYYRKAVSSFDAWTGIEGTITLPQMELDPSRVKPTGRFLDNPSIYMGGRSGSQEIDAGLSWEVIRETDGSVSAIAKAFRPFWRNDQWHNAPAVPEYYYYPGDTIRMSCRTVEEGKLALTVELLARAGTPASGDILSVTQPISVFSTIFDASSFGPGKTQQFKRVNAIDQSGNEGQPVQPTKAEVTGAVWHEVWLWRGEVRLPFNPARFTDMRCPATDHFVIVSATDLSFGAETISIFGEKVPASSLLMTR